MSGGHFDYYQHHISDIADKLEKSLADIEYAKSIGTVKKKEVYGHLLSVDSGNKYWPNWFLDVLYRHDNREDVIKHLVDFHYIYNKDGKIYYDDGKTYEVVIYDGESEEWADGNWHLEIEDPEVVEEFKKGLKILKTAAIYAQRIDWLLSGDDGEDSFKRRLKDELDELERKPLIDYEYWNNVFKDSDDD
jgi:hypothetical protein